MGVHFTPRMNGEVWLGPNAVLAFKREGYNLLDVSPKDLFDCLAFRCVHPVPLDTNAPQKVLRLRMYIVSCFFYRGLRKLVFSNFSYALGELYRGVNIRAQVNILQRFVPSLQYSDVTR